MGVSITSEKNKFLKPQILPSSGSSVKTYIEEQKASIKKQIEEQKASIKKQKASLEKIISQPEFAPRTGNNIRDGITFGMEIEFKLVVIELFTGLCISRPPPIIRYIMRKGVVKAEEFKPEQIKKYNQIIESCTEKFVSFNDLIKKLGFISWDSKERSVTDFIMGPGTVTRHTNQDTFGFAFFETIVLTLIFYLLYKLRNEIIEKLADVSYSEKLGFLKNAINIKNNYRIQS